MEYSETYCYLTDRWTISWRQAGRLCPQWIYSLSTMNIVDNIHCPQSVGPRHLDRRWSSPIAMTDILCLSLQVYSLASLISFDFLRIISKGPLAFWLSVAFGQWKIPSDGKAGIIRGLIFVSLTPCWFSVNCQCSGSPSTGLGSFGISFFCSSKHLSVPSP